MAKGDYTASALKLKYRQKMRDQTFEKVVVASNEKRNRAELLDMVEELFSPDGGITRENLRAFLHIIVKAMGNQEDDDEFLRNSANDTSTGTITAAGFVGPLTGLASTSTILATARTIGGTSFNGSANIAVGLATTATTLATARTIGGTSFNGSANIAVNLAATATLATNITVTANNTTAEAVYLTFVDGATGTQGIETDTNLAYNPNTNVLAVPNILTKLASGCSSALPTSDPGRAGDLWSNRGLVSVSAG